MKARDPEAARQRMADFDARVLPIILELRDKGMSINVIARILTARHIAAQPGRPWTPHQVRGLLARAGLAAHRVR
jgi:DNA-binding transcriptional MerR regulator